MRRNPKLPRCALLVAATLFVVPGIAACGATQSRPEWTAPAAAAVQATPQPSSEAPTTEAALAAWKARPTFVRASARTEEAYAFALSAGDALQWIPCYCGCGAMGHTSSLDCFFKRTMAGLSSLTFEEHASFCTICVDEALIVKQMLADGHSMREIRTAIDGQFGNLAPGTSTELPRPDEHPMTTNVVPNPARERELLAHLGLGPGASDDEVEAAHDDIVRFLEDAPSSLRGWARGRLSEADRTYAILNGGLPDSPLAARPAPAVPLATAIPSPAARPTGPAAPAARQNQRSRHDGRSGGQLVDEDEIAMLDEQDGHSPTAGRNRAPKPGREGQRIAGSRTQLESAASALRQGPMRRFALVGGLLVAFAAIAVVGYKLGEPSVPGITGSPVPGATTAAIDATAVTALMEKLSANPKDITTLKALADLYYAGGDFQAASSWLDKVLAIDPKNITALLGAGAAAYNLGDDLGAEKAWRAVLAIDETNVEAHYDLGWMYLGKTPTDVEHLRIEWTRVIALDPGSDAAKTALSHLQRLDPSFSPPPAASTAPGSPAPSLAPTTRPS